MCKYKITMRSGMVHETEAKSETSALVKVRDKYYSCWTFEEFEKQVMKIERVTE